MFIILDNTSLVNMSTVDVSIMIVLPVVVATVIAILLIVYIKREVYYLEGYLYGISQALYGVSRFDLDRIDQIPPIYSMIQKIKRTIEDLAERTQVINNIVQKIDRQTSKLSKFTVNETQSDLKEFKERLDRLVNYVNRLAGRIETYLSSGPPTTHPIISSDQLYRLDNLVDRLTHLDSKLRKLTHLVETVSLPVELQEQVGKLHKNIEDLRKSLALLSQEMKTLREESRSLTSLIMRLTESGKLDLYRRLAMAIKKYMEVYNKIKERTDSGVLYGKMYEDFLRTIKMLLLRSYEILRQGKMDPEIFISISEDIKNAMDMLKTLETNIENPMILRVHRKITAEGSIAWPEIEVSDLKKILEDIKSYIRIE